MLAKYRRVTNVLISPLNYLMRLPSRGNNTLAAGISTYGYEPNVSDLLAELDEFGWADEGEVFGVEEVANPFAFVGVVADFGQAALVQTGTSRDVELRETIANGQHEDGPFVEKRGFVIVFRQYYFRQESC